MAGHSKFKNIMHRKGKQDAQRAKQFTKIGREIIVSAKQGGGDPAGNPRLRAAIAAARAVNMPNDRIKRAIDSAVGNTETDNYKDIRYEGYGPGGVAIIVEALTDNNNRTAAEVRSAFTKQGGTLGETNSVSFMFERVGEILYPADKASADAMFEAALEAGAQNVESDEDLHEVTCAVEDFSTVRDALSEKFGDPEKAGLTWKHTVGATPSEDQTASVLKLIEVLEDDDDVQNVYSNLDVDDDLLEKLMG